MKEVACYCSIIWPRVIKGEGEKVSDKRKQRHAPESELFNDINGLARLLEY